MPTALLSVFDKTGIADFAAELHALGWRIVSSGGTAKVVAERGVPVTDVADLTGVPAILDHRVVTLHPKVHGGLLADPTKPEHIADMEEYGIEPISLVVANLYPFTSNPGIELIDIGGPAMVRASAKNHAHVAVIVDPDDYEPVLTEIAEHGEVTLATRRRLARDAFAHTATYDAAIVTWFDATEPEPDAVAADDSPCPRARRDSALRREPASAGARYRLAGAHGWWDSMVQHGGKPMSYLNLYDSEAAWRLVNDFDQPACVIIKHANPCGVAVVDDADGGISEAYRRANACDPVSAFGGIVALNRPATPEFAAALGDVFTEVVVAPGYDDDALGGTPRAQEPAGDHRQRAGGVAVRSEAARRRVDRAGARPGVDRSRAPGESSPRHNPPTSSGTTSCLRGRCVRRSAVTPSSTPNNDKRSVSAPDSRTGSTRPGSPASGRLAEPPVERVRAMPSFRSVTDSTPLPQPALRR